MGNDSWRTPRWLFDYLNAEFGPFTLDAAASDENHLCDKYYTEQNSGLDNEWNGIVFCNPPYSDISPWVKKAGGEAGRILLLLPSRTGMAWFQDCLSFASVCFVTGGRIKFIDPTGGKRMSPSEDHILVGFGIDLPRYLNIREIAPEGVYKKKRVLAERVR